MPRIYVAGAVEMICGKFLQVQRERQCCSTFFEDLYFFSVNPLSDVKLIYGNKRRNTGMIVFGKLTARIFSKPGVASNSATNVAKYLSRASCDTTT